MAQPPGGVFRKVLIALCGLTPQVVTETLWALGRMTPSVVPDEIWILTTGVGRAKCLAELVGSKGAVAAYFREYPPRPRRLKFDSETIISLNRDSGSSLEDVRTARDNEAVANNIAEFLRTQTARPDVRLHCSVAGGRKTMGVLLAAALQLYGRADDRLYHVLVSPPAFENHPEFFFPPKRPRTFHDKDGTRLDMREAVIELAEVPFIPLRAVLSEDIYLEKRNFTALVEQARKELRALLNPEPVRVDLARNRLVIGTAMIRLRPAQARLYTALARIKKDHCTRRERPQCGECTDCYPRFTKENWDAEKTRLAQVGVELPFKDIERFRSELSKVNATLAADLGSKRLAERYAIRSVGEGRGKAYGLAVDKTLIRMES